MDVKIPDVTLAGDAVSDGSAPILSVIVPVFNEKGNVSALYQALSEVLENIPFEVVFVNDDSRDGTTAELKALCRRFPNARTVHRVGRRGLSSAVVEGILSTVSPFICVIDADLQHDEKIVPAMLALVRSGEADIAVGSRHVDGGGLGNWEQSRVRMSNVATRLAHLIARVEISDPMSGFFVISRDVFDRALPNLSSQGFKILLDICSSTNEPLQIREVPYVFRTRTLGESKLDTLVIWEYLLMMVDKLIGSVVPARFISFAIIGGAGVFVHMTILTILLKGLGFSFIAGQSSATLLAMVFNFFVNNLLTYRDRRLRGFRQIVTGLLLFIVACSFGALANVGVANFLFSTQSYVWWVAGVAGILVGVVWNYAATAVLTWRAR